MNDFILVYDGGFDGLLSAIFFAFENKLEHPIIQNSNKPQTKLFGEVREIITEQDKANRVWKGMQAATKSMGSRQFYYSFLSEQEGMEQTLLAYAKHIFSKEKYMGGDYGEEAVLKVSQTAKMVGREKHRMEAFIRFKLTKGGIYFANIEPDFNVLPIISRHFKNRYADQEWIIYDLKRKYGLHYDLKNVSQVEFTFSENFNPTETSPLIFAEEELAFQSLWQNYFQSSNIKERKNMKLHIRHIPKRYWKYLSEKQA